MSQLMIIALTAAIVGALVATSSRWVDIPLHWYPSYYTGVPTIVYVLLAIALDLWNGFHERRSRLKEPDEHQKFIVSVDHIDRNWHDVFAAAGKFVDTCTILFDEINQELYELCGNDRSLWVWRYKMISEMTADGIRIMDSVLSQLKVGHPDTALGTTRQLFELAMFQKAIAYDETGETGKRYQDFAELRYLQLQVDTGFPNESNLRPQIEQMKGQYSFGPTFKPPTYSWIKTPNGGYPNTMEKVIDYVTGRLYEDRRITRVISQNYMQHWVTLNNWAHISKSASRRKLGIRTEDGYLQAHLLEKSEVGFDTPLMLSTAFVYDLLATLEDTASKLTGKSHRDDMKAVSDVLNDIRMALREVSPTLLANDVKYDNPYKTDTMTD